MKKVLVFLLVLALSLGGSALAFNETGYPISDEVVTITMAAPSNNTDWSEYAVIKGIERDLGIKLVCTPYNPEAWENQFTLMLAGGTLPDFLLVTNTVTLEEVSDLGSQGYFLPLNDLIEEYAPNITAMMEKVPDLRMYSTSADGNMYTIVGLQGSTISTADRSYINRRWLENLGLDYPTTVDELKEVLIAFRDQDANGNGDPSDEIPMSNFTSSETGAPCGLKSQMINAFGLSANSNTNPRCIYLLQEKDGQVYLGETSENYKAYLEYMHDLWVEELLDHDDFIQTSEEFNAKAAAERVGIFWAWAPFVAAGKALDYDQNFYWLGGMSSDYQPERIVHTSSRVTAKPYYLINAKTEYGPEIVRLIDYFFSDEGMLVGKYGYEGDNYTLIDMTIPGLEDYAILKINQPEGYSSTEQYRNQVVTPAEVLGPYVSAVGTYHAAAMAANAEQLEMLLPMYGWGILVMRDCLSNDEIIKVPEFPVLQYTEAENKERASLYTDISLYIDTMQAAFITGAIDIDAGWDEFIQTLNTMQLPRLLEIEQEAYDRLVGNH